MESKDKRSDEDVQRTKLAERLRTARDYLGFSQDDVAKHLGISRSALSNIETGQRKVEVTELTRLASLYKQPISYFTGAPGAPEVAMPADVEHLARKASKLSAKDREELARFADFLRLRTQQGKDPKGGQ